MIKMTMPLRYFLNKITPEMIDGFESYMFIHKAYVKVYHKIFLETFPELLNKDELKSLEFNVNEHDNSKYDDTQYLGYIFINWMKQNPDMNYEDKHIKLLMREATVNHVLTSRHHPDYHAIDIVDRYDIVNLENRNSNPNKPFVLSSINKVDLTHIMLDWSAMAHQNNNSIDMWLDKVIGYRWIFHYNDENFLRKIKIISDIGKQKAQPEVV